MQIGNQLPGLKMRSIVVGGVSEDKVSVHRGFRGCIQVRQGRGTPPFLPPAAGAGLPAPRSEPLVSLLLFSK